MTFFRFGIVLVVIGVVWLAVVWLVADRIS